jgi:hypothetical protein
MEHIFEHPTGFSPVADVVVDMSSSGNSDTTISTNYLGPCLVFLITYSS